jgi:hypothetical protein
MPTLLMHIMNEDPILCEVDKLPASGDLMILVKNPRRKDGKDLIYLDSNVTQVFWPISRINFIEVIPTGEEEEIISFVRE